MRVALEEAHAALLEDEVPVGAVVVREGRLLSRAHNARERTADPTAHAEVLALRAAAQALGRWTLTGCTLYVTLEPCPLCAGALVMSRVCGVVFGAFDEKLGCCGSVYKLPSDPALGAAISVVGGVLQEECQRLLSAFFAKKRQERTLR